MTLYFIEYITMMLYDTHILSPLRTKGLDNKKY